MYAQELILSVTLKPVYKLRHLAVFSDVLFDIFPQRPNSITFSRIPNLLTVLCLPPFSIMKLSTFVLALASTVTAVQAAAIDTEAAAIAERTLGE